MVATLTHDIALPGELTDLVCDLCDNPTDALYPLYCTEVVPTNVDYLVCRDCRRRSMGIPEPDETLAPF